MGSFERSFDNGARRAVTGRTRQVNRAGANDRYRRIHVIAAHSGEGPFIVRFADLCQRDGI